MTKKAFLATIHLSPAWCALYKKYDSCKKIFKDLVVKEPWFQNSDFKLQITLCEY